MKVKTNSISIVIPVYNEEFHLEELGQRLLNVMTELQRPYEIVLVDDGSRDRSTEIMAELAHANPQLRAVLLNRNYGQHAAVMAGFEASRGDYVITLDADLQNPPEEIPKIVEALDAGNDVVGSVRQKRQDSLFRKLGSRVVNGITRKSTGVGLSDYGCMLRGYRRAVIEALLQCRERSLFIPILANQFARRITEVPVSHKEREGSESKYSLWKLVNLQFDLLTSVTQFPLRLLSIGGGLLAASGIIFGAFLMVMRLIFGASWAAEGVFTLFSILFVFSGFQLIGMGLLGEYIGRIYHDVRARPRYFVERCIGNKDTLCNQSKNSDNPLEIIS